MNFKTHTIGRGVAGEGMISTQLILTGHLIATCPFRCVLDARSALKRLDMYKYLFIVGERVCIAFGDVSLMNHSYDPNARLTWDFNTELVRAFAVRDIEPHTEIFHYYANVDEYDEDLV